MLSTLAADIRLACRSMRRQPTFALLAVGILALGIGANTAMFSLLYASLLKDLPYPDPDRLVVARTTVKGKLNTLSSTPDYYDYKEQAKALDGLVATHGISLRATVLEPAERVMATRVSPDFFTVLGVRPIAGRAFATADGAANAPFVAVIGERMARQRFGTPQAALGRTFALSGVARTAVSPIVVGVLPSAYRFMQDADVWLPMRRGENDAPQTRNQHRWLLVGRLKRGMALPAAQQEIDAIAARLQHDYPASNKNKGLQLDPLRTVLAGPQRARLIALTGAVGLVLLVACANVGGLLLARAGRRRSELAVRSALGATRGRIVAQLLVESALLAALAGALGVGLAVWLRRFLAVAAGVAGRNSTPEGLQLPVLLFALGLSMATALLFGAVPAIAASKASLARDLVPGGRSTTSRSGARLRSLLVAGQVAVSLTLVVAAGLLLRSFARLSDAHLGFDASGVLAGTVELPRTSLEERLQFYGGLRDDLAGLPGVLDVGFISHLPIRAPFDNLAAWRGGRRAADGTREQVADMRLVLPGYFRTLRIPIVAGRDFSDGDRPDSARVLVINQRMAQSLFPGENPIGQHVSVPTSPAPVDFEVVGVVGDARIDGVALPAPMAMYSPVGQFWEMNTELSFVVRTGLTPDALSEQIRRLVAARNPNVAPEKIVRLEEVVGDALLLQRATTLLLGLLSGLALVLAATGLYGVLAQSVATRTRELGIRMALGAAPGTLVADVLAGGALMVMPGLALGLACSRAASKVLERFLYEVPATDPVAYGAGVLCLAFAAMVASLWPALRAARLDPVRALRAE